MSTPITQHEGKKYLRLIHPANGDGRPIYVDVYSVLVAFGVTCPATAHAVKKLLAAGQRGKGDKKADLVGAIAAINRAIDLDSQDKAVAPVNAQWEVYKGEWEVYPAIQTDGRQNGKTIGWLVRWSVPDEKGRYLWVGHYYAGEDGEPSIDWCHTAATNDAKGKNDSGKVPTDIPLSSSRWSATQANEGKPPA